MGTSASTAPPQHSEATERSPGIPREPALQTTFQVGDGARYYSDSLAMWMDCQVLAVNQRGEIQISCKPGHWHTLTEQATKLQRPVSSMAAICVAPEGDQHQWRFLVGDKADYFSDSAQRWCPCTITDVATNGSAQVDVKPGYWIAPAEQASKLRLPCQSEQQTSGCGRLCPLNLSAHNASLDDAAAGMRCATFNASMDGPTAGLRCPTFTLADGAAVSITDLQRAGSHNLLAPSAAVMTQSSFNDTILAGASHPAASHSQASLSSTRPEFSSVHSTSSLLPAKGFNRVAFDPGVSVTAFKAASAPSQVRKGGRTFECSLESSIQVPQAWSFSQSSSVPSTCGSAYVCRTQGPSASFNNSLAAVPEATHFFRGLNGS